MDQLTSAIPAPPAPADRRRSAYPLPPADAAVMTREELARHLGITLDTLKDRFTTGRIALQRYRIPGDKHNRVCFLADDVRSLRHDDYPPPPPGKEVVFPEQAAALFGVSIHVFTDWEKKGKMTPTPIRYRAPAGTGRMFGYLADDLAVVEVDELPPPPAGKEVMLREACAVFFGVSDEALKGWEKEGKLEATRYRAPAGSGCRVCYLKDDIVGLDLGLLPLPPVGKEIMLREETAAFFGIAEDTLQGWENEGKVTIPRYRAPSDSRCRVCYLAEDAARLREQMRAAYAPYPDPDRPGCYRVPIVMFGGAKPEAIIDADDLPKVLGRSFNLSERSDEVSPRGVVILAAEPKTPLKDLIVGRARGDVDTRVSHANGDYLDCRRSNLVVRTHAEQNYGNRKMRICRGGEPPTSVHKGVSWMEIRGAWTAHIGKDKKAYYLGLFDDEDEAGRAYDNAARQLFGEHAYLNFPDERPPLTLPRVGALSKPGVMDRLRVAA